MEPKSEPQSPTPLDILKKYEEVAAACNRCGYCTSFCPTYLATGSEAQSPRGRVQTFRSLIEGKLKDPSQALDIVDTCLLCGECTSVCFSEVPTAELMGQARNYIHQTEGVPKVLQWILKGVLPRPKILALCLKGAFLGKKLGIAAALNKVGLLKKINPILASAEELVSDVPLRFLLDYKETKSFQTRSLKKDEQAVLEAQHKVERFRKKDKTVPEELFKKINLTPARPSTVAYVPVCGSQYLRPRIGFGAVQLFNGVKVCF